MAQTHGMSENMSAKHRCERGLPVVCGAGGGHRGIVSSATPGTIWCLMQGAF